MSDENLGVEVQEVTDPVDEGAEVQEVTDPAVEIEEGKKTPQDAAFAQLRRENEAAQREIAELKRAQAENEARKNAIQKITGRENAEISAIAEQMGLETDDFLATLSAEEASQQKDIRIQMLESELQEVKADRQVQESINELQKIDPNIKSIDDLGDGADMFIDYISKGLSVESAYYATKAKEINTRVTPPPEIGKANMTPPEKSFFTEAEVDAMTPEEQKKHADKIIASMPRW